MRPAEVDVLRGNSIKAFKELGWKPKTNFRDGIKKTIDFYREKISENN